MRAALATNLPVAAMFAAPTIAELSEQIARAANGKTAEPLQDIPIVRELVGSLRGRPKGNGHSLATLRPGGPARPLFCIHGLGGHIASFLPLAGGLDRKRPVYGLQAQGLDAGQQPHDSIEEMAAFYLSEIREVQPRGPYLLAGWSMGGVIGLEMAQSTGGCRRGSRAAGHVRHLSLDRRLRRTRPGRPVGAAVDRART